jgi:hypothetical protein
VERNLLKTSIIGNRKYSILSEAEVAIKYAILPSMYPLDKAIFIGTFALANSKQNQIYLVVVVVLIRGKKITMVYETKSELLR